MKTLLKFAAILLLLSSRNPQLSTVHAQGTAFTYQGRLNDSGNPASGIYDLRFAIFDAASAGVQQGDPNTNSATAVSGGLFTVTLDFGSQFPDADRWLEIAARTNGNGAFTTLAPRQKIAATPYAITAGSVTDANLARLNVPNTAIPATGHPVVTNGFIIGAVVDNGGTGYTTAPLVSVSDSTGSGANLTAAVSNGSVVSLVVNGAGNNYSAGATLAIGLPPSNAYQIFSGTNYFNNANFFNGANFFTNGNNVFAGSGTGLVGVALLAGTNTFTTTNVFTTRVGIGTTTPQALLHVANGSAGVAPNPGSMAVFEKSSGGYLSILTPTASENGILFGNSNNAQDGGIIFNNPSTSRGLQFRTGTNTTRMIIANSGNVGVGTLSPSRELEVQNNGDTEIGIKSTDAGGHLWTMQSSAILGSSNLDASFQIVDRTLGSSRFSIGTNGNVGIGTSAPTNKLQVNGTITATGFSGNGAGLSGIDAGGVSTGTLADTRLSANVALRSGGNAFSGNQTISSGNVGIGTTSPQGVLHVAGSTVVQGLVTPSAVVATNLLNLGSGATADGFRNGISFYETSGAMAMSLGYDGIGSASLNALRIYHTSGSPLFTFQANGNVGIGTTNPLTGLHVKNAGDGQISLESSDSGGHRWTVQSSGVNGNTNLDASFQVIDRSLGIARLLIGTNGNVGIGTTKPAAPLEVNGTVVVQDLIVSNAVRHPFAAGAAPDLIHPIAYGNVSSLGGALSGTPNFTATWDSGGSDYLITIAGESYSFISYTAIVTPIGFGTVIPATFSASGKLMVSFLNTAGTRVQSDFCFVVYKAN